jgi:glycosyltransferase involved in cell wall biosynthesis
MSGRHCVVFLCQEHELWRELKGYYDAFSKRITTVCTPLRIENGYEQLDKIIPADLVPILILQPDVSRLPHGLVSSKTPTACFQIDTYSGLQKRLKWSMLYDYVFVFHPGFDRLFNEAGHPRVICLPHAVEAVLFERETGSNRTYEVGWVGTLQGSQNRMRRRYIDTLKACFHMNELDRHYSPEEMAAIYSRSKIVVNISRDDHLSDANLRCFEAMAAGALLITAKPTELADYGFIEGVHYIAFESESDLCLKVKSFLADDTARQGIARAGRSLVIDKHTYDRRVDTILEIVGQDKSAYFSPARQWDDVHLHETYLHYFAKHLMLDQALTEMRELRRISRTRALRMAPTIVKAFVRSLQLSI